MRHLHLPGLVALLLAAPILAPARARADTPAPAMSAAAPLADPPSTTNRALAISLEVLSPGAGCVYRHRYLSAVVVAAGSLVSGGMLLYALHAGDRDTSIVSATAFGVLRAVGLAAAAPSTPPTSSAASFLDPGPRLGAAPTPAARTLGLSYGLSF